MLADIIFPAPSAAYVAGIFLPLSAILALATEFSVYIYFQRGVIKLWRLFGVVFGVNLFSWTVGLFLSFLLPNFLVPQLVGEGEHHFTTITQGPHWGVVATLSFVWACFVSTLLEYFALWVFRRKLRFRRLGLCVTAANVAGYIVIGAVVWVCLHFQLYDRSFLFRSIFDIFRTSFP
jgi:hypothetical protein